ncbi:PEP-utilizing enzyme [Nocardia seriolae]|uniref:PEP-utilizing enzyme n=1 Tax=Nocardia seriolae TaxID=37332 RepID=UPI0034E97C51
MRAHQRHLRRPPRTAGHRGGPGRGNARAAPRTGARADRPHRQDGRRRDRLPRARPRRGGAGHQLPAPGHPGARGTSGEGGQAHRDRGLGVPEPRRNPLGSRRSEGARGPPPGRARPLPGRPHARRGQRPVGAGGDLRRDRGGRHHFRARRQPGRGGGHRQARHDPRRRYRARRHPCGRGDRHRPHRHVRLRGRGGHRYRRRGLHAAIVAREFGVPCVVDTKTASDALRDGQRVRVDGAAGTITLLADVE